MRRNVTAMTYTKRIAILKEIIILLKDNNIIDEQNGELEVSLNNLRKYSDIAQIISKPKNEKMSIHAPNASDKFQEEIKSFNEFKDNFWEAQSKITLIINENTSSEFSKTFPNKLRDIFDGYEKNPTSLFHELTSHLTPSQRRPKMK